MHHLPVHKKALKIYYNNCKKSQFQNQCKGQAYKTAEILLSQGAVFSILLAIHARSRRKDSCCLRHFGKFMVQACWNSATLAALCNLYTPDQRAYNICQHKNRCTCKSTKKLSINLNLQFYYT